MIADTPEEIEFYRLRALRSALKLEILGMKRRGQSAYSIIKKEFGFKGSRNKVLRELNTLITTKAEQLPFRVRGQLQSGGCDWHGTCSVQVCICNIGRFELITSPTTPTAIVSIATCPKRELSITLQQTIQIALSVVYGLTSQISASHKIDETRSHVLAYGAKKK